MEPRKYKFNNSTLTIIFGDITKTNAEVIVSSDDTQITMSGGVSACILKSGGEIVRQDAQKKTPSQLGDVIVSTSGAMELQKFVFHCITLECNLIGGFDLKKRSHSEDVHKYILQHSIDKCFRLLQALELNSIAFPCIGTGAAEISLKMSAEIMAEAISLNLCRTQKPYNVELYLFDSHNSMQEMDYIDIFEKFAIKSALSEYQSQEVIKSYYKDIPVCAPIVNIPKRDEMNHQVFISYSRKDKQMVDSIRALLEEFNISYWIDKEGVYSGENYKEIIVDAIEVAKVVVFISSVNSNSSVNVIRELGYAVQQRKTIIPLLLDDAQYAKSIRLDIADISQIEYKELEDNKKKFITSLEYALSK